MRTHRIFTSLQPWIWRTDLLRALVGGAHFAVARIEPVTRGREASAVVDCTFADGDRCVTVPLAYVDLAQLAVRESDPIVFPNGLLGVVSDARIDEVVERLLPHLERRASSGGFWNEEIVRFAPAPAFDRARAAGFFGAAPLATSLPRIAGAVYAQRFAPANQIVAYGPNAEQSAAFLRATAKSCGVPAGEGSADARAWYGAFDGPESAAVFDLAIGTGPAPVPAHAVVRLDDPGTGERIGIVAPLPSDIMLAFVPAGSGPAVCSVTADREPFTRDVASIATISTAGGSAGRIALAVRPDADLLPDADTDEVATLARHLRGEGFTVGVVHGIDALAAFAPDLVHLFGVRPGAHARRIADWASANRKPLIVHAFHEAPAAGGYWGTIVAPYCFAYSADDRNVGAYLDLLGRRAVEVDGIAANVSFAPAIAGLPDAERVLAMADVVLVQSERERAVVEPFRQQRLTRVVPPLPILSAPPAAVAPLVGPDPFILVHAPVGPEQNQLILARAAAAVGAPIIFAGPIADPAYAERLREFAPPNAYLLDEPSPATLAGLYRTAAVMASAAWISRGHGRLNTAAALGAAIVCSNAMWLALPETGRWIVDPASVPSVARGLGDAWDAAVRGESSIRAASDVARTAGETAAGAVVDSYAKIVQAV